MGQSLKSRRTANFKEEFKKLPHFVQKLARKSYSLWKQNPSHSSLKFKPVDKIHNIFSARIGIHWRVLGKLYKEDNVIVWFWVGSHEEYNNMI